MLRKKTSDRTAEKLLTTASKQGLSTIWDRYESQTPTCGFGRLGMSCTACTQGPCRLHPFEDNLSTTCGRDQAGIKAASFLRLIINGAAAQMFHIKNVLGMDYDACACKLPTWLPAADVDRLSQLGITDTSASEKIIDATSLLLDRNGEEELLSAAVKLAVSAFICSDAALSAVDESNGDAVRRVDTNLGSLRSDKVNILVHGDVPPSLSDQICLLSADVNLIGMCGSETEGRGMSIVGNDGSQELVLLPGLIDAVVMGRHCVTPGFRSLAEDLGVPAFDAYPRNDDSDRATEVLDAAQSHFRDRTRSTEYSFSVPKSSMAMTGFDQKMFASLSPDELTDLFVEYGIRGVALVAGCNNVKSTQDEEIVRCTEQLLQEKWLVLGTGCAGAALGKVGLMDPNNADRYPELAPFLVALGEATGTSLAPVLHFGNCRQLPRAISFMKQIQSLDNEKFKAVAVFPENSRASSWCSSLAVAVLGIPTYVGPALPYGCDEGALIAINRLAGGNGLLMSCDSFSAE